MVSIVCRYGSQVAYWLGRPNGLMISRWSRVSPASTPIAPVNPLARKSCTERARVFPTRFPAVG